MNREEVGADILNLPNNNILLELPTSFGKSKIALDWLKTKKSNTTLIVIPRLVLIENWKAEFKKWKMIKYLKHVTFTTYMSLHKYTDTNWDCIIFDEAHHLSERCRLLVSGMTFSNALLLSATVNRDLKKSLPLIFNNLYTYKISARQAIREEILPDPKVYLIPLSLDNVKVNHQIIKNPSAKSSITIPYSKRFAYSKVKNLKVIINCTQRQYYDDMSSLIAWYKKKVYNEAFKNLFLRKSGERLKWLSEQKSAIVKQILNHFKNNRTLTFCNGIAQTKELGEYCINSKNHDSQEYLALFNEGKINHITACNMLDEGINLTNCQIGIYAVLNSSERMIKQKLGRLLRHPNPIIVIPYFKGTRDEEIVKIMIEDYNPELIEVYDKFNY